MRKRMWITISVIVFACVSAGIVFAANGTSELPNGFGTDLWKLAQTAGPFGTALMLGLWYRSDKERRDLQSSNAAMLERVVNALNGATNSLAEQRRLLEDIIGKGIGR